MAESLLANPVIAWLVLIGIVVALVGMIIYFIFSKRENALEKEIRERKSTKTQYEDLKQRTKIFGKKLKNGKLMRGTNQIGKINKWYRVQGKFDTYTYDENTKNYEIDLETPKVPFDLHVLSCFNPNFILAFLHLKMIYFIIDSESIQKFDPISKSFLIDETQRVEPHGDIWTNSKNSDEYRTESSIKEQNIEMLTAIEVYPLRISASDPNQIKKERLYREMMETDKARYDAIKKAEDTVIS